MTVFASESGIYCPPRRAMQWLVTMALMAAVVSVSGQKISTQRFEREPEDQTAVFGEKVVLACRVLNKSGLLQWTKDDFGLGTERDLAEFERYSMIGIDDEGTYSLEIRPVTLEEEGKYQCQVGPGPDPETQGAIRSRYASLTVYVPPDSPQIVQGSHLVTTEDREVELECQSRGGKPASEVNWLDSDGNLITEGVEVFKDLLADGMRTNVKSILKLKPKKEFHNKTFTCQAQNAAERSPRMATIRLEVKYAPKVTVKVFNTKITEMDMVKVTCSADANPSKIHYKWLVNNEVTYGDYSTELTINSATRILHNAVVKCEVRNDVGTSEDSQTLDIHYSPRIIEKPSNVEADVGSNVTLRCVVDSNPPAEISWTHESSSRVLSTGSAYTFWIGRDMGGRYTCTARVPGFTEVSADASVFLKGPPTIISKRTQFGAKGDAARLECYATSIPKPDRVFWTQYGRELDIGGDNLAVVEDTTPDGTRSTLIIRDASDSDFGPYNCTVLNSYGTDVAEIVMQQQRSFPFFTILVAVVVAIILLVICIISAILLHKRCRRSRDEKDKSVEKQSSGQSDRSSNNESVMKVEVRTNSSCSNQGSDEFDNSSDRITPKLNGDSLYRYSDHFPDTFIPQADGRTNVGYHSYQDLDPVGLSRNSLYMQTLKNGVSPLTGVNPHFAATYGNPYLRNSSTSLPQPAHVVGIPTNCRGASAVPQSRNSQFITASSQQLLKPGTLATHV